MRHTMQHVMIASKLLTTLLCVFSVCFVTGCISYEGERAKLTPDMRQEIDRMSTDEAVGVIRQWYSKLTDANDSYITVDEWKKKSRAMSPDNTPSADDLGQIRYRHWVNAIPSRRTAGYVFEDIPPETWQGVVVTPKAIEYRTYIAGCWKWYWVLTQHKKWYPPKTDTRECRYRDMEELRIVQRPNGKKTLTLYSGYNIITGYWYITMIPATEDDFRSLKLALIKLCPKIKVDKSPLAAH